MLFSPDISTESVETEKEMIQSEYTSGSDDPEEVEYMARERILGEEGLGRTAIGTPDVVRKLTVEELRRFDRQVYVPSNVVVSLAGRLDRPALDGALASWDDLKRDRPGEPPVAETPPKKDREPTSAPDILFERVPRASCDLVFAYPAFGEGDPALLAASMLRHVLHQRISDRLRRACIPVYDLWLHTHSYRSDGIFYVGARVTGTLVETVDCIHEEIRKITLEGPTEGEVERAKEWNRTYLVQMLDRPDDYAARLAIEELYGTRLDPAAEWRMTDEIQVRDLHAVARRLFDPRSLTFCLMGNPGFREKRQIRRIIS
jgi:zinc protease